ncbi:MAG: hypothetical protein QG637_1622 [Chloroflexota bacterium]|nr:hypothetical protein [Chloroflexota bacterium]
MYRGITEVQATNDYRLILKFDNNERRLFDLSPYLSIGRFAELRDINVFKQISVSFDTVEWKNGLDIDPEFLYAKSEATSNL